MSIIRVLIFRFSHAYSSIISSLKSGFKKKKRCIVVCWNASHNPIGRAFLFADFLKPEYKTLLVGPIFERFGPKIWKPLRRYPIRTKFFKGHSFPVLLDEIDKFSETIPPADLIIICKPRMPSILLGLKLASKNNAQVILDIDDHELAFCEEQTPIDKEAVLASSLEERLNPFSDTWTRYAESLVNSFKLKSVSNIALQKKFGGAIIPHVRDDYRFNPRRYPRNFLRRLFGYKKRDKIVLFLGTPRGHKGFQYLPTALKEIDNPNYKLLIVGKIKSRELRKQFAEDFDFPFLKNIGDVSFRLAPYILAMGDLVCLIQDPNSPVSKFQMPAKFTDALAMGIPVIATATEPIQPLIDQDLVYKLNNTNDLPRIINEIFQNYTLSKARAKQNRAVFIEKFSYEFGNKCLNELSKKEDRFEVELIHEIDKLIRASSIN